MLKIPVLLSSLTWDFIYIINGYFIINASGQEEEKKKKTTHTNSQYGQNSDVREKDRGDAANRARHLYLDLTPGEIRYLSRL